MRTHRNVERARAYLAALIETSPVGRAAFDAATGDAVALHLHAPERHADPASR